VNLGDSSLQTLIARSEYSKWPYKEGDGQIDV
jgi:hypothetical protein